MKYTKEEVVRLSETAAYMKVICTELPKNKLKFILALMGPESYDAILEIYGEFSENPDMVEDIINPATRLMQKEALKIKTELDDQLAETMPLEEFQNLIVGKKE